MAGSQIESGSGGEGGVLEFLRIRAEQQILFQTNTDQYVTFNGDRMGIQSAKIDFQKIEVAFEDLLTDKELEEMYIDSLAEGEIFQQELNRSLQLRTASYLTEGERANVRKQVAETAKNDPGLKDQTKKWLSGKSSEDIKTTYQQKYIKQPAPESDNRSNKEIKAEKQAELEKQQKVYDQMDQDRTAIYHWKQQSMKVMEDGKKAGKSDEEIYAMFPAPPVLRGPLQRRSRADSQE